MSEQATPEEEPADESVVDSAAKTEKQIAELEDSWRRTAAELENFRKRCAKDVVRAREQERTSVAARWLPILDSLERALEHASSDPGQIVEGVRAVRQQALAVLTDLGFPPRDNETGKPFDPAHHEAVSTIADENLVPGTVAHVVRAGYGTDDRILRPASVVVATRGE
ncbi:nucleotide exchange factor GrpE [Terrabacter sp. BE26]|uniref:nucleotide exchange factor GrpE n=1 Tax=Terrabacter sp. BE26 TaxID=2898152 RepID=UPI0035BE2555